MSARIIAVTNQKGGCGKTTVTMQLAGALAQDNRSVLVVDADHQGTATRWFQCNPSNNFPATVVGLDVPSKEVHRQIRKFVKAYDWILVDCPAAVESVAPESALLVADLAIVPVSPDPPDVWSSVGICKLIDNARATNENLQATFLINKFPLRETAIAKQAVQILEGKGFKIPILKSRLHLLTAYPRSILLGNIVSYLGKRDKKAIQEISSLKKEILKLFQERDKKRETT